MMQTVQLVGDTGKNLTFFCVKSVEEILNPFFLCFRYSDKGGARLWRVAVGWRFHAEPQWPEQSACSDGRWGHGDAKWGRQEVTQSSLYLPQLQRVRRKVGFWGKNYQELEVLRSQLLKGRQKIKNWVNDVLKLQNYSHKKRFDIIFAATVAVWKTNIKCIHIKFIDNSSQMLQ